MLEKLATACVASTIYVAVGTWPFHWVHHPADSFFAFLTGWLVVDLFYYLVKKYRATH
jgi:hypothetical protein